MDYHLHHEVDVTVVAARPWGLEVESGHGSRGFIDNTKSPAWPSGDQQALVGTVLRAVVIDDRRDPVRLSTLDTDIRIAREKRSRSS
ncbi:hypothetical protein [Streptomyces djakartensis]|uniref:Uncharacterized protein n=1 Tax=Streptomyces djakartensis TaxID=68193 RepID=A0ABQ2ZE21_9ACTN|nr:hypothetical protein [Streptomyces djakartensis]GGY10803.1 hypothetical protein GCM10010384_14730 [Streptomyces djakartensis]